MAIERKFIDDAIIKYKVSKFLSKALSRGGFSRVEIQKTPVVTRISVYVLNPGKIIGRGGKNINDITETVKQLFHMENPQINVVEVENKMLEPTLVAKDIAQKLERAMNYRKIITTTLKSIMANGAVGAEIIINGKLKAKNARARSVKKSIGYIPKAGEVRLLIREGIATAYPKYGAIGVKVRIAPPGTVFPSNQDNKQGKPNAAESSMQPQPAQPANAKELPDKQEAKANAANANANATDADANAEANAKAAKNAEKPNDNASNAATANAAKATSKADGITKEGNAKEGIAKKTGSSKRQRASASAAKPSGDAADAASANANANAANASANAEGSSLASGNVA